MLNRLRRIFESIVYAGMQKRAPVDPLYLSNRTWKQKLRVGLLIAIPGLVLAGAVALGLSHMYAPKRLDPNLPTRAEIIASLPVDLAKDMVPVALDVQIQDLHPDTTGSPKLVGALRNNTDRTISVEFTVDLTNRRGSRVDAVTPRVEKAPAKSSVAFQFPIPDADAAFAVVRYGTMREVN